MKKGIWILVTISLIFIIAYKVPYSRKIDKVINAIQFRIGDSDYEEELLITIKGVYKHYLFKDDIYDGIIKIDKYGFTNEFPLLKPITLENGNGLLIYGGGIQGKLVHEALGLIICTPRFDELFISVNEKEEEYRNGWNSLDGLCISGPAENKEQALDIVDILSKDDNVLSDISWD